jgi:tetratricopeptide (TPR) repeat protein
MNHPPSRRLAVLLDEREHLLSSLEDLEREYAAGDVDEQDYTALRARYVARAAETIRAIEAESARAPDRPRSAWWRFSHFLARRRVRRSLIATAVICGLGVIGLLVASLAGVRVFGGEPTGSVSVPTKTLITEDLAQAAVLGSAGQLSQAISLYDDVLALDARNVEALTYKGWLERLAGIAANKPAVRSAGDALLATAVRDAPHYPDARAFYGLALLEDDHERTRALSQFDAFLASSPPARLRQALGAKIIAAYRLAGRPVPKSFSH